MCKRKVPTTNAVCKPATRYRRITFHWSLPKPRRGNTKHCPYVGWQDIAWAYRRPVNYLTPRQPASALRIAINIARLPYGNPKRSCFFAPNGGLGPRATSHALDNESVSFHRFIGKCINLLLGWRSPKGFRFLDAIEGDDDEPLGGGTRERNDVLRADNVVPAGRSGRRSSFWA